MREISAHLHGATDSCIPWPIHSRYEQIVCVFPLYVSSCVTWLAVSVGADAKLFILIMIACSLSYAAEGNGAAHMHISYTPIPRYSKHVQQHMSNSRNMLTMHSNLSCATFASRRSCFLLCFCIAAWCYVPLLCFCIAAWCCLPLHAQSICV